MSAVVHCYLNQIKLNVLGYEHGPCGKYWGVGDPLYRAEIKTPDQWKNTHLRAKTREDAKTEVLKIYPNALFFL